MEIRPSSCQHRVDHDCAPPLAPGPGCPRPHPLRPGALQRRHLRHRGHVVRGRPQPVGLDTPRYECRYV